MIFKHGQVIKCKIQGMKTEGRISICDGNVYICQNTHFGGSGVGMDMFGYSGSWNIGQGTEADLRNNHVTELELGEHVAEVEQTQDYNYWKARAISALTNHNIPTTQFETLEKERLENKARLHEILGMNEENNYRILINTRMTESVFHREMPKTVAFIEHVIKEMYEHPLKYSITKNKVMLDAHKGKKLSKVLKEFSNTTKYVFNDAQELMKQSSLEIGMATNYMDTYISSLIDLIKPKELVLSSNIFDMLTSSTYSSYGSCYNMNGEYFNGNLAYIRDTFTLISFTHDKDIARKVGRAWVYAFLDDHKLFSPMRPYGSMYRPEYKLIRKYIQKRVSEFFNITNRWKFIPNVHYDYEYFTNGRGAVYFDFDYIGISYHKTKSNAEKKYMEFRPAICMECGDDTLEGQYGTCSECEGGCTCSHCGEYVDNLMSTDSGDSICKYCYDEYYGTCIECDGIFHYDSLRYSEYEGGSVCRRCREIYYVVCDVCEELVRDNNITYVEGSNCNVCSGCLEDYSECEDCGKMYLIDELLEIDDAWYCSNCYVKCDECGKFTQTHHEGKVLCDECVEVKEEA